MQLKNRVRLKNTILYCNQQKYKYGSINGQIVLCFNEEKARNNKEKRIDQKTEEDIKYESKRLSELREEIDNIKRSTDEIKKDIAFIKEKLQ